MDGSDYGIERMRELLDALGSPDDALRIVHVAGTNGKGSVCAMLTSVLGCAGYRVGTYNSPSVLRYNERFSVDGTPLCDDDVAKYMTVVKDTVEAEQSRRAACGSTPAEGLRGALVRFMPTAFEIETALALVAFRDKGCDVAVLETGLGGRWDATNAVHKKELAVITKIGLDHCALLGNTLGEIAAEKAAIIKGDAVTCPQEAGAAEVLYPLAEVCRPAVAISQSLSGQVVEIEGERYEIPFLGRHQLENAALAVAAAKRLAKHGFAITESALEEGLKRAVWHARFEVLTADNVAKSPYEIAIPSNKTLVLDGAHNPQGAAALAAAMKSVLAGKRIAAVTGVLADKDYTAVMKSVVPLCERAFVVTPGSPRALDAKRLKEVCAAVAPEVPVTVCNGVKAATEQALRSDADAVVVFGSLTLFCELV